MSRHRLVVEFESLRDMEDFAGEAARQGGVPSAERMRGYRITTTTHRPNVTNTHNGASTGITIMAGDIEGGVQFP